MSGMDQYLKVALPLSLKCSEITYCIVRDKFEVSFRMSVCRRGATASEMEPHFLGCLI